MKPALWLEPPYLLALDLALYSIVFVLSLLWIATFPLEEHCEQGYEVRLRVCVCSQDPGAGGGSAGAVGVSLMLVLDECVCVFPGSWSWWRFCWCCWCEAVQSVVAGGGVQQPPAVLRHSNSLTKLKGGHH